MTNKIAIKCKTPAKTPSRPLQSVSHLNRPDMFLGGFLGVRHNHELSI